MKTKLTILASSLMMLAGGNACAELYISPIVSEGSSIHVMDDAPRAAQPVYSPSPSQQGGYGPVAAPASTPGFKVTTYGAAQSPVAPSPAPSASPVVAVQAPAVSVATPAPVVVQKKAPGLYGKAVPLKIAANNLVPNRNWVVNIEAGQEMKKVSWSDAANYEEAFNQIERSSGLHITVNKNESAVGIAISEQMANNLAKRSPNIYTIKTNLSLRKNLEAWAAKANWNIVYQDGLTADYDGLNPTTLTVPFEGAGGAADVLLQSTWNKKVALMGRFKSGNRTLYIEERGFDRANKLDPAE
jgi:hypothetical protein